MYNFWSVDIRFGNEQNTLGISTGQFAGNVDQAISAIRAFSSRHDIKIVSEGYGWNELTIEEKTYSLGPYGIDIDMMLKFCGINLNETADVRLSQSKDSFVGNMSSNDAIEKSQDPAITFSRK